MKMGLVVSIIFWAAVGAYLSGCAGVEAGGKFGLYAVDQRREVQETSSKARPFKCLFIQCPQNAEYQGS